MALEPSVRSRLELHLEQYKILERKLSDPEIIGNSHEFQRLSKERGHSQELVETFESYQKVLQEFEENKIFLEDDDESIREMAKEEHPALSQKVEALENQLRVLLLPKDPLDDRNIILEIRAGAGGDEASLFAGELLRAYKLYASAVGWRFEVMEVSTNGSGGIKEAIAHVYGDKVYSKLKFESGVHRVQRVPSTEGSGRIHTSTITVAVLPEADEVDVQVNQNELRIDVFRAGGPGGQSVNTTDSAVRITHLPTGLVVICQDEKSQQKNKDKAFKILRARLYEAAVRKQQQEIADARRSQVGTGDRSERIRTYNFPQSRVTDHRIGLTLHNLTEVMEGHIEPLVDGLITHHQAELLKFLL